MLALSDLITEVERQGMLRNPIAYREGGAMTPDRAPAARQA